MALFGKSVVPEESAALLGSIRLVVVGEPFVGKTALTELIANGQPSKVRAAWQVLLLLLQLPSCCPACLHAGKQLLSLPSPCWRHHVCDMSCCSMQASRSTAGCHIHVKLVDTSGSQAGDGTPRRFFVELWDVSGQPKYEQLRSVFYKQINGETRGGVRDVLLLVAGQGWGDTHLLVCLDC